ncbi:MAG: sulfurtransferase [Alphaproteobacteria bacterium]|nr:sulfurtransferase [Alphaproteobacteria bacterium]
MAKPVEPRTLKSWLHQPGEIALLDVREAGQFGEAHLFYAVPLPYSRLELDVRALVPRLATRIVLCDEDGATDGVAARAARRLEALGYSDVGILAGGTRAWAGAGYRLFAGVNVPSKAFAEVIEVDQHTPHLSPAEVHAMAARGEKMVIVDGRPFSEYQKMNIPGGICCPNGELALRIAQIAPEPDTRIVVNCAGRTRSIIGAETLRRFGIANPVHALENGTQGWFLAGLELERGATRRYPAAVPEAALRESQARASALAARAGVPLVDDGQAAAWLADGSRTTYLFDVRTPEEFAAGSLPGAIHAPGGQLQQTTDQWVGTRGARLLLADSEGVRAIMTADWLRRMGHDAHVLASGVRAKRAAPVPPRPALPELPIVEAGALSGETLIDLRDSAAYRAGHARGAIWSIRPRIAADARAAKAGRVALIAEDPMLARAAALDLHDAGIASVALLRGELPQEKSPATPPDSERIDFLFFAHDRHQGNPEAARTYLNWELSLVAQLDAEERAAFRT